ncbi:MAG: tetratricopeptide repeat protein [Bacteroidota bacterium]
MQKKIAILILLSVFNIIYSFCLAQNSRIDSLNTLLKTTTEDTTKVNALNKLFEEYEFTDAEKAKDYLENATKLALKNTYKQGLIKCFTNSGFFADDTGNYQQALVNHQKALNVSQEIRDKRSIASSFYNVGNIYLRQNKYHEALKNVLASLKINKEINDNKGVARSHNTIGNIYKDQGNYPEALKSFLASLKINEEMGYERGMATSYNNLGIIHYDLGNYPEALKNDLAALKIHEKLGNKTGIANIYSCLGNIYNKQGNFSEALKNDLASLKINNELGNNTNIAIDYNNIGNIYEEQGNYSEALKNHFAALKIRETMTNKSGMAASYNNIGLVYMDQGNYPEALKNFLSSLTIRKEIGNRDKIAISYINLASLNVKLKKFKEANQYLVSALSLSKKIGNKEFIKECFNGLADLDSAQGNWREAYKHRNLFFLYRDSLNNEENTQKMVRTQMTYEFDKKESLTKAEQDKKDAIIWEEKKHQKMILLFVIGGFILVVVFSSFMYNRWRTTKRQKLLIENQKQLVDVAYHQIEEKNKEITDSINYASRIQQAMLTSEEYISKALFTLGDGKPKENFFIFYQPKDIVSGDFYWAYKEASYDHPKDSADLDSLQTGKTEGAFYVVTADCTGHGVPGAFMSLLNINFLNENVIERNITEPNKILNKQRQEIIKALNPKGTENSQDGMDCVLCKFDFNSLTLTYSAAYNPLWIIRRNPEISSGNPSSSENELNGDLQLIEYKADKMPVGKYNDKDKEFTQQIIQLQKGDTVYTFTDGYADQFGGPNGKKFKYKALEDLLLSVNHLPMLKQRSILKETINSWKGNLEQVDDILIIGIQV